VSDPESLPPSATDTPATDPAVACGDVLRSTREAAGLSIETVAQQLKLHPRQVKALEDGAHDQLPGRTFVRGFLRNYARALQIDPDALIAMLPDDHAPQTLVPTHPGMGEIHLEDEPRRTWTRWAIPLVLAALVALAAVYEFLRPGADLRQGTESRSPATPAASAPAEPAGTPAASGGTPLPNPLLGPPADTARRPEPAPSPASSAPAETATAPAGFATAPTTTSPAAPPTVATAASPAPAAGIVSTAIPPAAPGEPVLVLVFSGKSWTEVKDATGKVLLSLTGTAGMTQSVTGRPPFDLVIGNVAGVTARYRGAPVDLSPYRSTNIARLRLE
jgi:cytoskeleton protein RodZ